MHEPAMSVLRDSTIASQCHDSEHTGLSAPPRQPRRKTISIPAVSAIVKESWNWAGETIHTYRDGLSAEERRQKADREDRKQVLYLKIKNVSGLLTDGRICSVTWLTAIRAAGCVVRGMAELRQRIGRAGG